MSDQGLTIESGLIRADTSKADEVQPVIDQLRQDGLVIVRVEKHTQSLEELFMGYVDQANPVAPPPIPGAPAQPPSIPQS